MTEADKLRRRIATLERDSIHLHKSAELINSFNERLTECERVLDELCDEGDEGDVEEDLELDEG